MSDVIEEDAIPYTVKTVSRVPVDFVPVDVVTPRTIRAIVQPAQKDALRPDSIDWSLRYLLVHTTSQLDNGEYLEYQGEDFKVIDNGNYQDYGFTEAVCEQTKKALLVVTP